MGGFMEKVVLIFFFMTLVGLFLSFSGFITYDLQLEKTSLAIMLTVAALMGFWVGKVVTRKASA